MIIDHIIGVLGPSILIFYNGEGKLWLSAADGFVFLAGLMVGYLYVFNCRYSWSQLLIKFLQKAFLLYLLSAGLTVVVSLLFPYQSLLQTGVLVGKQATTYEILVNSLLFTHHVGWTNILTLYACLFLVTPIIVLIARKSSFVLIIISLILWLLVATSQVSFTAFGFFDILAWQLVFVLGIVAGKNILVIRRVFDFIARNRIAMLLSILFFVGIVAGSILWTRPIFLEYELFNKINLGVGRIILLPFWIFGTYSVLHIITNNFLRNIGRIYEKFGQNSLFVYTVHAMILPLLAVYGTKANSLLATIAVLLFTTVLINFGQVTCYNTLWQQLQKQ